MFSQAFAFFFAVSLQKVCGKLSVLGSVSVSAFQSQSVLRSPPIFVHIAWYFVPKGLTVLLI